MRYSPAHGRVIRLPGREEPLRLKLPQGLQDGDVLELDGIRLKSGGAELIVKLLMTVEIALPRPAPVPAAPPAEQKRADKPKRERGYTAFAVRSVLVLAAGARRWSARSSWGASG